MYWCKWFQKKAENEPSLTQLAIKTKCFVLHPANVLFSLFWELPLHSCSSTRFPPFPPSSCGCSSGSRMSCGGWRRNWPPRTSEYASWNSSSTTWRTLAPTTPDLLDSWTGKASLPLPPPLLTSNNLLSPSPCFFDIFHYIITSFFLLFHVVHTITW